MFTTNNPDPFRPSEIARLHRSGDIETRAILEGYIERRDLGNLFVKTRDGLIIKPIGVVA